MTLELDARSLEKLDDMSELLARYLQSEDHANLISRREYSESDSLDARALLVSRGFKSWIKKTANKVKHAVSKVTVDDVLKGVDMVGQIAGAGRRSLEEREEPM